MQLFFKPEHLEDGEYEAAPEALKILEKVKGTKGLLQKLATNEEIGIVGDTNDITRRHKFFGNNKLVKPQKKPLLDTLKEQLL